MRCPAAWLRELLALARRDLRSDDPLLAWLPLGHQFSEIFLGALYPARLHHPAHIGAADGAMIGSGQGDDEAMMRDIAARQAQLSGGPGEDALTLAGENAFANLLIRGFEDLS